MGQILEHGIYLPDEGERNCYDGLASNWSILDGAVGTVAEHTTALAGKAPAVHTHTKADVTDLLNSNFIPSANNSYDLGSSSYQWNNLYAKNYFYNGTQWGLNKANTWTGDNTYTKYLNAVINDSEIGVAPLNNNKNGILFKDKNGVNIGWLRHQYDSNGDISIEMLVSNKYKNGVLDPTGTQVYQGVKQVITASGDSYFNWSGTLSNSVVPRVNNTYGLGTSTYKWKSLNGINPGALSLPSADDESFNGDLTNKTGTTSNKKTWSINGWGYIRIANVAGDFISVVATSAHETYLTTGTGSGNDNIGVAFPIVSGREYAIYVKTSGSVVAYYMPTLGNVA